MECSLDVWSVKVYCRPGCLIVQCCGEGQHVPQQRAHLIDLVEVEAWVDVEDFIIHHVEQVAIGLGGGVEELGRLHMRRWERQILLDEVGISAGLVLLLELGHEGLVEVEQIRILLHKGYDRDLLLDIIELANAWVVCQCTYVTLGMLLSNTVL